MSFVDQDDVIELTSRSFGNLAPDRRHGRSAPATAHLGRRHGRSAPTSRICGSGKRLSSHRYFAETTFRVFQAEYVCAVIMPGGASQPRRQWMLGRSLPGSEGTAAWHNVLIGEEGELGGPVARNLADSERSGLAAEVGAAPGDCIFFAAGPRALAQSLLGATRLEIGRKVGLIDENAWAFCWVVDAPLFEPASDAMPTVDVTVGAGAGQRCTMCLSLRRTWKASTRIPGQAGVCLRHHLQRQRDLVARSVSIDGHSGTGVRRNGPPEGGSARTVWLRAGLLQLRSAAAWWDRVRWGSDLRALVGKRSIREVIAFPKSGGGVDPLTGAPTPITAEQRKQAGIDVQWRSEAPAALAAHF